MDNQAKAYKIALMKLRAALSSFFRAERLAKERIHVPKYTDALNKAKLQLNEVFLATAPEIIDIQFQKTFFDIDNNDLVG